MTKMYDSVEVAIKQNRFNEGISYKVSAIAKGFFYINVEMSFCAIKS